MQLSIAFSESMVCQPNMRLRAFLSPFDNFVPGSDFVFQASYFCLEINLLAL
jgi:hypothetical protein